MRSLCFKNGVLGIALLSFLGIGNAQQGTSAEGAIANTRAPMAATAPTSVPALVPFSSAVVDSKGKPFTGETTATFLIYKDQQGGEPLFTESQFVAVDQAGQYKVQLGATHPSGLPADLFATGEARWLEVQIAGQQPEARVLIASVPYALKAADAATLGGLPASAFALAGSKADIAHATPTAISPDASAQAVTTIGGTANRLAKFTGVDTIANSTIYDNGVQIGIGTTTPTATLTVDGTLAVNGNSTYNGQLLLPPTGTATATSGFASQFFSLQTSAYNSASKSLVPPRFQLQAEVTGNNTASPSATLHLLASAGTTAPVETGFYINTNGTINFAPTQKFPIAAGPQGPQGPAGPTGPQGPVGPSGTAGPNITVPGTITAKSLVSSAMTVNGNSTYNGQLILPATATATPSTGYASQFINLQTSAYNSSTKATVAPRFQLQAEPNDNNSTSPYATLNLLASTTTAAPTETGFSISTNGFVTFAPGQTFYTNKATPAPGIIGNSTTNNGVEGTSSSGKGVSGSSTSGTGVQGSSSSSYGVEGVSNSAPGVLGYTGGGTNNTGGVVGQAGTTSGYGGIAGVWGDAYAHVGVLGTSHTYAGVQGQSTGGQGVLGSSTSGPGVQGSSTTANGVYGFSSNTSGVHGETQSTSAGDAAVYGGSDSIATGVIGVSTNGIGVEGLSTNNWAGRFSNSSSAATVYATNTTSSGGAALYATAAGTNSIGLYTTATAGSGTGVETFADANGVYATSNGDILNTAGVLGVAGYRTGVGGIAGVWGDAQEHVGVIGSSKDYSGVFGTSTNSYGVQASSTTSAAVYGVGGASNNPSIGSPTGVWGDVTGCCQQMIPIAVLGTATVGEAGQFTNNSSLSTVVIRNYGNGGPIADGNGIFKTLEASSPKGTCGFGGNGDMTCTGQVKALATAANGTRTVETYSMQSPENWMEDFGSGTLQAGVATVAIEAAFAETVSAKADYHVFLTPQGESKGLYVTKKTATSFEVHESGGGVSTIGFDYRIVAKRRGFEAQRMTDVTEAMNAVRAKNNIQAEQSMKPDK